MIYCAETTGMVLFFLKQMLQNTITVVRNDEKRSRGDVCYLRRCVFGVICYVTKVNVALCVRM